MSILIKKAQNVAGMDVPAGMLIIGLDKEVEALAAQGGGALPLDVNLGGVSAAGKVAWRNITQPASTPGVVPESGQPVRTITASLAANVLTVSAVSGGAIAVGHKIEGAGLFGEVFVTALGTGTGAAGTYTVSGIAQTLASQAFYSVSSAGITVTTDLESCRGWKATQRVSRFRFVFGTGDESALLTAFDLSGHIEVSSKNGSPVMFLPLQVAGLKVFRVPAGGGLIFRSDWVGWPLEVGDTVKLKPYLSNGGSSFTISAASPLTTVARCVSGIAEMAFQNRGDNTARPYGASPWTIGTGFLGGGCWNAINIETDTLEEGRIASGDGLGDSIGFGAGASSVLPWLDKVFNDIGVAFNNMCISGTNQTQIPYWARQRMKYAVGDFLVCQHGKNAPSNTAELQAAWRFGKASGYRKTIQALTTNTTNAGNTAVTQDASAMRAFQLAQLGQPDGPDALLDVYGGAQDPATGLWYPGFSTDGLHPADAGHTGIANYLETAAGVILPGGLRVSAAAYFQALK